MSSDKQELADEIIDIFATTPTLPDPDGRAEDRMFDRERIRARIISALNTRPTPPAEDGEQVHVRERATYWEIHTADGMTERYKSSVLNDVCRTLMQRTAHLGRNDQHNAGNQAERSDRLHLFVRFLIIRRK